MNWAPRGETFVGWVVINTPAQRGEYVLKRQARVVRIETLVHAFTAWQIFGSQSPSVQMPASCAETW